MTISELIEKQKLELHTGSIDDLIRHKNRGKYLKNAAGDLIGLNLWGSSLADIDLDFLSTCPKLEALVLNENKLTSLVLPQLPHLKYLLVNDNAALRVLELSYPLSHLVRLEARRCALTSLDLPRGCNDLVWVEVQKNKLTRLVFEDGCPNLRYLDAAENKLTELTLPSGMSGLRYLYLNDNELVRFDILGGLPLLNILHVRNNKLNELPFA